MASMRTLHFVTMLVCLSCSVLIKGQDISKHLAIENGSELRLLVSQMQSNYQAVQPVAAQVKKNKLQTAYVYSAGYHSKGHLGDTHWHGVKAEITLWKIPDVQPLSTSGAFIAASTKSPELELIAAGFHVNPSRYNDNKVHFFTYWTTTSDHSTGCYNNDCPGFIVANGTNLYPGEAFAPPLSTYGGEQRFFTIRIKKDEHTKDWSLYREDLGGPIGGMTLLGWWPGPLFKNLSHYAEIIQWTGFVSHNYNETSPSMGSGHFASELDGKAASFNDCLGFSDNGYPYYDDYSPLPNESKAACYDVSEWYETEHAARRHFFYGGPGGCSE